MTARERIEALEKHVELREEARLHPCAEFPLDLAGTVARVEAIVRYLEEQSNDCHWQIARREMHETLKRAEDAEVKVAQLCAERDKYLGECAQLYEAFRPQSIANPREARQHIENLRDDAGREGERETARLIRELSVERDDAVKRAEETIKRAEQACLEALREKAHATKRAESAESQISVYAAQTDGALAGQVEYVKRAQAAEGQLAAAIADRDLAQQGVRWLTSQVVDLQSQVEMLKNERNGLVDSLSACWHCKVLLEPEFAPCCIECPNECDNPDCHEEGCAEARAQGVVAERPRLPRATPPR